MHPIVYFAWALSQGGGKHTKIGKTKYLRNRKTSLDTSYSEYGINFQYLIECENEEKESEIEEYLHAYFDEYSTIHNTDHSGGLEWFNKSFEIDEIKNALNEGGFDNEIISDPNDIERALQEYKAVYEKTKKEKKEKNEKIKKVIDERKKKKPKMRDYQETKNIINWFDINDKGILNWCCGLGKTLTSINISTKYFKNYLLIGLNNLALTEQWIESIKRFYDYPFICVSSEIINGVLSTTNIEEIKRWFKKNTMGIVITTYRSAHKLLELKINYSFSILDEVHHLCNSETVDGRHRNTDILKLDVNKRLGLTATMKEIDDDENENKIDNMDVSIFGEIIDGKSVLWGIENNFITDYRLSVPRVTYQELEEILGEYLNRDSCYLYLSAYIALMTLIEGTCNKLLIFVNKIQDMEKLYDIIMIMNRSKIENSFIENENIFKTNNDNMKTSEVVHKFNVINKGILINCFKIGEGVDVPSLDGVLFADNMESTVRITQAALRACRKDPNNEKKIATIIVPTIYEKEEDKSYDEDDNIKGFGTILNIIKELSISDDNVIQKIVPSIITPGNSSSQGMTIYQDIDEEYKFKMRIITRGELGKRTFPSCKRIIQKMGGRKDNKLTFYKDYENNKQNVGGLPDINWMKTYLDKNNKTWIELYSFDKSQFLSWEDFEKKFKKKITYEEYENIEKNNTGLPEIHDLEDIYKSSNYNRGFWDDSCYEEEY